MKGVSLRLILEDKDKGGYQFVGSNLGVEIFLKKREHHKKVVMKQKIEAFLYTLYWYFKQKILFTIYTYVLAKLLQNGAKFKQKTDSQFKKSREEFRQLQASSRKSLNLMDYLSPKNTFLQLRHRRRIYTTLLLNTCVKIHQITYVIFETTSHFSRQSPSKYFSSIKSSISYNIFSAHYILSTKVAYQS